MGGGRQPRRLHDARKPEQGGGEGGRFGERGTIDAIKV